MIESGEEIIFYNPFTFFSFGGVDKSQLKMHKSTFYQ